MAEDQGYVIKEVGFTISPPLRVCHHQHPSWCLPQAQIVLINCVYCIFDRSETEAGFSDVQFISLHIRSMWETICDAWACWSGWNFVQILPEYPYSEVQFQNPPPPENENCQRVQIREFQNTPPNENCQRVQIREFQNTPSWKWKLSESPNPRVSEYPPKMKIVRESKSESFRIPPPLPWKWKLSESPNLRVSEYPPPQNWKNFRFQTSE